MEILGLDARGGFDGGGHGKGGFIADVRNTLRVVGGYLRHGVIQIFHAGFKLKRTDGIFPGYKRRSLTMTG